MVLLTISGSAVCRLFDQCGRPIGTIVRPVSDQTVGHGAGTVLLTRGTGPAVPAPPTESIRQGLDL